MRRLADLFTRLPMPAQFACLALAVAVPQYAARLAGWLH